MDSMESEAAAKEVSTAILQYTHKHMEDLILPIDTNATAHMQ